MRGWILRKEFNFEIYIVDLKASTCSWAWLFLLRCVNPAALPLVRCYSIRLPRRVASWVDYSRHELSRAQWALRQWFQLAEDWCIMMWNIAVIVIEPLHPPHRPTSESSATFLHDLPTEHELHIEVYCFIKKNVNIRSRNVDSFSICHGLTKLYVLFVLTYARPWRMTGY